MRDISDELNNGGEKYDYTTLIVSLKSSLKKLKVKINMMFHALFCLLRESNLLSSLRFDNFETKSDCLMIIPFSIIMRIKNGDLVSIFPYGIRNYAP